MAAFSATASADEPTGQFTYEGNVCTATPTVTQTNQSGTSYQIGTPCGTSPAVGIQAQSSHDSTPASVTVEKTGTTSLIDIDVSSSSSNSAIGVDAEGNANGSGTVNLYATTVDITAKGTNVGAQGLRSNTSGTGSASLTVNSQDLFVTSSAVGDKNANGIIFQAFNGETQAGNAQVEVKASNNVTVLSGTNSAESMAKGLYAYGNPGGGTATINIEAGGVVTITATNPLGQASGIWLQGNYSLFMLRSG